MKPILIMLLIVISCNQGFGQDNKSKFKLLSKQTDNEKALAEHIKQWKESAPDDPELYIACFNYYFNKSKQEIVHIETQPGQGENLVFNDSNGKTAGYIFSDFHYDDSLFSLSQNYIDEGLKRNPKRLDMYFGKVYALGQAGLFDNYQSVLLSTIDLSVKYNYDWLWTGNKKLDDAQGFFKGTIQQYCKELFGLEAPQFGVIIKISEKMISCFPDDVENYSNIGACYAMQKDYKKGAEYFLIAHKINTEDLVVINNIALCYEKLNDNINAIHFYELLDKYGNSDDKMYSKNKIEELKKKK